MRIVFMGTPYFAAVVLRALVEGERAPVLVVSQPDRPKGRGRKLEPTPVHAEADTRGIPFIQPEKLTKDAVARIADAKPDVIVVSAYGKILRKNLLDLPPLGCLNTHASLLPKYRGAAPIAWAVIRGEERTGVTIMKLDEGVDTGPTLLSRAVPITPEDDAQTLTEKIAHLSGEAILEALDLVESGGAEFVPQNDADATFAPMLSKEDGLIDWTHRAVDIDRLVRGVTPWPGAQTTLRGTPLKILKAHAEPGPDAEPHVVLQADRHGLLVATGEGNLRITHLQLQGKKAMDVAAFLNGYPVQPGETLGR